MTQSTKLGLRQWSLRDNPKVFSPYWEFYGGLWTDTDLELPVLELVRIKSAALAGCRH